jgi:AraC-like DNA-binding protein
VRQARLAAIPADVLANIGQCGCQRRRSPSATESRIHLLFEDAVQYFGQFLEEHRLKRAFAMLTDPMQAGMRISDIAIEAGFSELSALNRGFRRRFGDRPCGVRRGRYGSQ